MYLILAEMTHAGDQCDSISAYSRRRSSVGYANVPICLGSCNGIELSRDHHQASLKIFWRVTSARECSSFHNPTLQHHHATKYDHARGLLQPGGRLLATRTVLPDPRSPNTSSCTPFLSVCRTAGRAGAPFFHAPGTSSRTRRHLTHTIPLRGSSGFCKTQNELQSRCGLFLNSLWQCRVLQAAVHGLPHACRPVVGPLFLAADTLEHFRLNHVWPTPMRRGANTSCRSNKCWARL